MEHTEEYRRKHYWALQLAQLKGGVIIKILEDNTPDPDGYASEEFVGFVVRMPDETKYQVWLLSDEEGNGAGRFEISTLS